MKISQTAQKIKLNQVMDISVDVHKDILNFFFEAGGKEYSDECGNRTTAIAKRLEAYHQIANDTGKTDRKDPRVIRDLGRLDKVIRHRMISEEYIVLRQLNKIYDEVDGTIISLR